MDLISREAVAEKMAHRRDYVGRPSDPDCIIADEPSVPAVPLDKLCELLAGNAYLKDDTGGAWELNPDNWKKVLTKWMEEQDEQKEANH